MSSKNYNNLIELINYSISLFKDEIDSVKKFCIKKKSNSEKWFELIYSILVGTQIKTDNVRKCFYKIIDEYYDLLEPDFLNKLDDFRFIEELIHNSLKENGYRFYESKSFTIYQTILFFQKYNFNMNRFINRFKTFEKIRKELIKIKGIGLKIASHWLRNVGYYIPVIDIHLKNLLYKVEVINNKNLDYLTYERIQNELIKYLEIDNITFDLAIWFFGKNFCGNRRCNYCIINCKSI